MSGRSQLGWSASIAERPRGGLLLGLGLTACTPLLDLSIVPETTGAAGSTTLLPEGGTTTAIADAESSSTVTGSASPPASSGETTSACDLGTPEHCGGCGISCEGPDDDATMRSCVDETCTLTCAGEFYDVNGDPLDGCEAEDLPLQATPETALAITLPDLEDPEEASNPLRHEALAYGDARLHAAPETSRPSGRDDYYLVRAEGEGIAEVGMLACLGIVNFPVDNRFEICISDAEGTAFEPAGCATVMGGAESVCVGPPAGGELPGPYLVRVRKLEGTNTYNGYALWLRH